MNDDILDQLTIDLANFAITSLDKYNLSSTQTIEHIARAFAEVLGVLIASSKDPVFVCNSIKKHLNSMISRSQMMESIFGRDNSTPRERIEDFVYLAKKASEKS